MKYVKHFEESFYSIPDLCTLLGVDRKWIRYVCERYSVEPECVNGEYGFSKPRAGLFQVYLQNYDTIFYNSDMFSTEWSPIWG